MECLHAMPKVGTGDTDELTDPGALLIYLTKVYVYTYTAHIW